MFDPRQSAGRRKHSRGYLPHFDVYETTQFVTFRLADSMPQDVLKKWTDELQRGEITDVDLRKRIEQYLDSGYGACWLKDSRIANLLRETLLKWDGERYELIAWVIMPNHVHILIRLIGKNLLSELMHSIKSYTAHQANKILGLSGRFWSVESFDRYIRNAEHFRNTIRYIEQNPVKPDCAWRPEIGSLAAPSIPMTPERRRPRLHECVARINCCHHQTSALNITPRKPRRCGPLCMAGTQAPSPA